MGIDRDKLTESFFPPGSVVASQYTPCAIPNGCAGVPWYEFDPLQAQGAARRGRPPGRLRHHHPLPATRRRAGVPDPAGIAAALQAQLLDNLGIRAELVAEPAATYPADRRCGQARRDPPVERWRRLPGRERLPGSAVRTGCLEGVRQAVRRHRQGARERTGDHQRGRSATAAYKKANDADPGPRADDPDRGRGVLGGLPRRRRRGGRVAAPARALRRHGPRRPPPARVGHVGASQPACIARTRPTRSPGWSARSSPMGCTGSTPAARRRSRRSPARARRTRAATVWTCNLRTGVRFHDGATLDAGDVVTSFAAQWDADHPLHAGHDGTFAPFCGLVRRLPAPAGGVALSRPSFGR